MSDFELIDQFFKRDLTGAEDEALEELLGRSEDATDQFEGRAKAAYLRYGLPEPGSPSIEPPGRGSLGFSLGKWLLLTMGTTLVVGGFLFRALLFQASAPKTDSPPSEKPGTLEPKSSTIQEGKRSENQGTPPPSVQNKEPEKAHFKKPETKEIFPSRLDHEANVPQVGSMPFQPVEKADIDASGPGYSGLRVVVERDTPGLVTVRAVKPDGNEVQVLYAGILKTGRWAFEWDGKLKDGSKAPPGSYFIEVKSGPVLEKKEVWITK